MVPAGAVVMGEGAVVPGRRAEREADAGRERRSAGIAGAVVLFGGEVAPIIEDGLAQLGGADGVALGRAEALEDAAPVASPPRHRV